ncbi:lactoylglutathione lyase [Desulfobotulus alkaliphilus]|uniref:Lactoylglutathione lyase n=1 Tax=Desulfobotulus alkaliphilus TaxID=622671 RepID=A0A562S2I6_9BACT|nr:VOC family protein [Desulfobotulus alkaliphilus]TWI75555.1 lactoylglutathione lyase [Desulfobotulus alkaliphilus]
MGAFTWLHANLTVFDLEKSLDFYKKALDLEIVREYAPEDGSFKLVYLGDKTTPFQLELTWLRDREKPYNLGDNEIHLAFSVKDYEAALAKHREMGCVVFENTEMGIYFIADPDGYWTEILPENHSL